MLRHKNIVNNPYTPALELPNETQMPIFSPDSRGFRNECHEPRGWREAGGATSLQTIFWEEGLLIRQLDGARGGGEVIQVRDVGRGQGATPCKMTLVCHVSWQLLHRLRSTDSAARPPASILMNQNPKSAIENAETDVIMRVE